MIQIHIPTDWLRVLPGLFVWFGIGVIAICGVLGLIPYFLKWRWYPPDLNPDGIRRVQKPLVPKWFFIYVIFAVVFLSWLALTILNGSAPGKGQSLDIILRYLR